MKNQNFIAILFIIGSIVFSSKQISAQIDDFDMPDISVFDNIVDSIKAVESQSPSISPQTVYPPVNQPVQVVETPAFEEVVAPASQPLPAAVNEESAPIVEQAPVQNVVSTPNNNYIQQSNLYNDAPTQNSSWIATGWGIHVDAGSNLFYGDLRIYKLWPAKQYNSERKWAASVMLEKQLVPYLDLRGQVLYGTLSGTKREWDDNTPANMYFDANVFEYNTNVSWNITNAILQREAPLSLYTYAGMGFVHFRTQRKDLRNDAVLQSFGYDGSKKISPTIETVVPVGLGVQYMISQNLYVNVDASLRIVNTDKLDAFVSSDKGLIQDRYGYTSIGITYKFAKKPKQIIVTDEIVRDEPAKEEEQVSETVEEEAVVDVVEAVDTSLDSAKDNEGSNKGNVSSKFSDTDVFTSAPDIIENIKVSDIPVAQIQTPKPASSVFKQIESSEGLVFRVQILAVQNKSDAKVNQMKNMLNLNEIIYEERADAWFKFTVGNFKTLQEAVSYRQVLVSKGITDAFIVPYYQGRRITLQQARELQSK